MKDILIRNLSKAFGDKQVLSRLDMTVPAGTVTCLQGASGIGKTTLLRIIAGLETQDGGTVEGVPEKIAFVFQEDRLCEDFNALRNIQMVTGRALPADSIRAHLRELEIPEDSLNQPVREFSGGMKRRVAIARAVCADAELVLMDEPFKGLDEALKEHVMEYVKRHTAGRTVICVTHNAAEADYLGGQVIQMEKA